MLESIRQYTDTISNGNTKSLYFNFLKEFSFWNKDKDVKDITQEDIDKFFIRLSIKLKKSSVRMSIYSLKAFLKYCKSNKIIQKEFIYPASDYKLSDPQPRFISKNDYNIIIDNIFEHQITSEYCHIDAIILRNILAIQLLIETGVTVSELCNIKVDDIDFKNSTLLVTEIDRPHRKLKLSTGTIILLNKIIGLYDITEYIIFCLDKSFGYASRKAISPRAVEQIVRQYSDKRYSPKDFRWTYILVKLLRGRGIYEASDLAGGISEDAKRYLRRISLEYKKEVRINRNDYNTYEYLRQKYGKKVLIEFILNGKIKNNFTKELQFKYAP